MIFINMKFIISESKLEKTAINWLNNHYGDLTPLETEKYPNTILFIKDDKVIFDYNKKNGKVYIDYDEIWSFFESFFDMNYEQIENITKVWVEEHYKLRVTTTSPCPFLRQSLVEEHYKLRVTTTWKARFRRL